MKKYVIHRMLTDNPVPIHYNIYRSGPSRTLLTKSIGKCTEILGRRC